MYHIKLTNARGYTHGDTHWGPGVRHEADPGPVQLCTSKAIHFYSGDTAQETLALAAHLNDAHGGFPSPKAWVFEPEGEMVLGRTKSGSKAGTTVEEVALPNVTVEQRVEVAVRCTLKVYFEESWVAWAERWLSGADRSWEAAWDAAKEAVDAAWAADAADDRAEWAAADAAADAAVAATRAAELSEDEAAERAAWAAASAAGRTDVEVAKIAAEVYYREEEAECTTSS